MGVTVVLVCILEITVHVLNYSQPPLSASSASTDSTKLRPKILKKKKKNSENLKEQALNLSQEGNYLPSIFIGTYMVWGIIRNLEMMWSIWDGTFLAVQGLILHHPVQAVGLPSLVGKLSSHMPQGQKTKKKKREKIHKNRSNIVTNSIKTLKNVAHQKKSFKINKVYGKMCASYMWIPHHFIQGTWASVDLSNLQASQIQYTLYS